MDNSPNTPKFEKLVSVETKLLTGTAFVEIVKEVLRAKHDLLIVEVDNEKGIRKELLGSNELHLLRKCPCPVWGIKPRDGEIFGRILVPLIHLQVTRRQRTSIKNVWNCQRHWQRLSLQNIMSFIAGEHTKSQC